jgi:hypothetical protein
VLAGLEPRHAAHPWNVKQNGATGQPVLEDVDRPRLTVEERAVEGHVGEGVDVRMAVVVIVDAHVVLGEADGSRPDVDVGQHRHVIVGGLWNVDTGLGAERLAERDRDAGLDEPSGSGDAIRREVVQGPPPPVIRPAPPVGHRVEELAELGFGHIHDGHGSTLGRLDPGRIIPAG